MKMNDWTDIIGKVTVDEDFIEVQCKSPGGNVSFATIHIQVCTIISLFILHLFR
jgi:hypothetical protein